jgi:hypothetical protein
MKRLSEEQLALYRHDIQNGAKPTFLGGPHWPQVASDLLAEVDALRAELALRDVCEACGDGLMPEPQRCERHVHTEPGDPEWTEERGRQLERSDVLAWMRESGGQQTNGRVSSAWNHVRSWVADCIERGVHEKSTK